MTADVIALRWGEAPCACTACGHEWQGKTRLVGDREPGPLECPRCRQMAGVWDAEIDQGPSDPGPSAA